MIGYEVGGPRPLSTRTRWAIHTALLCVPILLSVLLYFVGHGSKLPQTWPMLGRFMLEELLLWGLAFAAAFKISRISAGELCLKINNLLTVVLYGIGWFIAVRLATMIIIMFQTRWINSDNMLNGPETVFAMMDAKTIVQHPALSFTVYGITALIAGLSEELWRIGMLRGLQGLFPGLWKSNAGIVFCIAMVALIFGVPHLYLGWIGVENAILLGFFFGLIVIYRNSYWEAAIAHMLFDLLSFLAVAFIVFHPEVLNAAVIAEVAKGDTPKIGHLLKMGADVNGTFGPHKISALEEAARESDPAVLAFLLDKGANPNQQDAEGDTALFVAAREGKLENVKLLLAHGADVNLPNEAGETPRDAAYSQGHDDIDDLLGEHGGKWKNMKGK